MDEENSVLKSIRDTEGQMQLKAIEIVRDLNKEVKDKSFFYSAHLTEIEIFNAETLYTIEEILKVKEIVERHNFQVEYMHISGCHCEEICIKFILIPKI